MFPHSALAAFAALALFGFSAEARAGESLWISSAGRCEASADEISGRVEAALAGALPNAARAEIRTEDVEGGVRLAIRLELGARELGTKTLIIPNCEEALDAAVFVLTVALGEPSAGDGEAPRVSPPERTAAASSAAAVSPAGRTPKRDVTSDRTGGSASGAGQELARASVVLLGGVDAGTLPLVTPYVGVAVGVWIAPVELRAAFRYGLRREDETEETDETDFTARSSADFGAFELSACRGAGVTTRFSVCAGGELGVVRVARAEAGGSEEAERDEASPRFAGVLSGVMAQRVGAVRLELELAGSAVAVGPDDASRASLRFGAGAGTQF